MVRCVNRLASVDGRHRDLPRSTASARLVTAVRAARPFAQHAASRAVVGRNRSRDNPTAGRFTRQEVREIVGSAFTRFEYHIPGLASEPTVGSRQNVALAALTLSLLEALEEAGIERAYAIDLTGDTCWRFYRQWGLVTRLQRG